MHTSVKKNIVLNILKTVITIVAPLITYPYILRVLNVDDLGKYNFSYSVISYFMLLASLGISTYAVREGAGIKANKGDVDSFISRMHWINWIFTIVSLTILGISILIVPKLQEYRIILLVQSLNIVFATVGMDWVNNIDENFLYITIRTILFYTLSIAFIFLFVKTRDDFGKYVIISSFPVVITGVLNYIHARKNHRIRLIYDLELKKHMPPILVFFFSMVAITIYVNADMTMLGAMRNDYEVGIYNTSVKIYNIMKQLFSAILIVILPRASSVLSDGNNDEYQNIIKSTINFMLVFLIPSVVGLVMLSGNIILIIGGEKYSESATPFIILSFTLLFAMMANILNTIICIPLKKERKVLIATIVSAILNIGLNFFAIPALGPTGAALTTLAAEFCVFLMLFISVEDKSLLKQSSKDVIAILIGTIIICVFLALLKRFSLGYVMEFVVGIVVSIGLYGAVMLIFRQSIVYELPIIKKFVKKRE